MIGVTINDVTYYVDGSIHTITYQVAKETASICRIRVFKQTGSTWPNKYNVTVYPSLFSPSLNVVDVGGSEVDKNFIVKPNRVLDDGDYTVTINFTGNTGDSSPPDEVYEFMVKVKFTAGDISSYGNFLIRCTQYLGDVLSISNMSLVKIIANECVKRFTNKVLAIAPHLKHLFCVKQTLNAPCDASQFIDIVSIERGSGYKSVRVSDIMFNTMRNFSGRLMPSVDSPVHTIKGNKIELLPALDTGETYTIYAVQYGTVDVDGTVPGVPTGRILNFPSSLETGVVLEASLDLLLLEIANAVKAMKSDVELSPLFENTEVSGLPVPDLPSEIKEDNVENVLQSMKTFVKQDEDTELATAEAARAKSWLEIYVAAIFNAWQKKLELKGIERTTEVQKIGYAASSYQSRVALLLQLYNSIQGKLNDFYETLKGIHL